MKPFFHDTPVVTEHAGLYSKPHDEEPFFSNARFRSFGYAWAGIVHFFRKEQNARIHLTAGIIVILLSVWFRISRFEVIAVLFSIVLVWMAEMFNTAIEKILNIISPEWHPQVKIIKDVAAGAVLVASGAAAITGLLIFIPKIF